MPSIFEVTGYHPPYVWKANGDLTTFPLSAVGALNGLALASIGAAAGQGSFDGFGECFTGLLIDGSVAAPVASVSLTLRQRIAGTAGSVVVELYRYRGAPSSVWTLVCTCTLGFGAGDGGAATVTTATVAQATINPGDVLVCVLVGVQTGGPVDLTATAGFG